jgi:hypothetical protein
VAEALAAPASAATPVPGHDDVDDSEAPTVVHPRPVLPPQFLPTAVQPAVPPPAPPPQESLGDALFGAYPEQPSPPPPPPPADGMWAPVPPAGRERSRGLVLLAAAAVGVIALVAGGVAVAATRGGGTTHGRSTDATVATDTDTVTTLPPGLALPAQGADKATSTPTATVTPTGTARPTGQTTPTTGSGGGQAPPATAGATPQAGGTGSRPAGGTASMPAGGATSMPAGGSSPPPPSPTTAPKTSSAPSYPTVCTPGGCAGMAYFVAYGEHLYVCDKQPDGYAAVAEYTRTDVPGQNNVAWNRNGSGTCIDHNMNMPEGAKITFRVCLGRSDGTRFNCGSYLTATS